MSVSTRAGALTLLLALTTALSACGSDEQGVDPAKATKADFFGGTCLVLAPDVLGLRKISRMILAEDIAAGQLTIGDRKVLRDLADRLRAGQSRAGGPLVEPLDELVAALDNIKNRINDNNYTDGAAYLERLQQATDDVIRACT